MLGQSTRGSGSDNTTWLRLNAKTGELIQDLPKVAKKNPDGSDGFDYPKASYTKVEDARVKRVFVSEKENFEDKNKKDKFVNVSLVGVDGTQVVITAGLNDMSVKLLGLVNAAELGAPVTLNLGAFEKDSEGMRKDPATGQYTVPYKRAVAEPWLTMSQNGQKLKAEFGLPAGQFPPKVDKIIVMDPTNPTVPLEGVKPVMNPKARNAFVVDLATKVAAKVAEAAKSHPAVAPVAQQPVAADQEDGLSASDVLGEDETETLAHR